MKAVRICEIGAAPRVDDVPVPPRGPAETLVRIAGASLAHLDRTVAAGELGTHPPLPYVTCTDGSGWVVESDRFAPGALVWLRGGGLGVERDGVGAEFAVVPDAAVHPAADGVDPLLAACFFAPATSAHVAVTELGALAPGERVLVSGGSGAVGTLAVQLALAAGAGEVIATVRAPDRAVPAGARVVVGEPGPLGADLLIDTIGGPGLPDRLRAVRPGGRAVLVGYTAGTEVRFALPALLRHDVALLPLNMIRRAPDAFVVADALLGRLSRGELTLPVTRFDLTDVAAAWTAPPAGRVVLQPGGGQA